MVLFGEHFLQTKVVNFDAFIVMYLLGLILEHFRWELHSHMLQGNTL